MERAAISETLLADTIPTRKAILYVRRLREQVGKGSKGGQERAFRTRLRSQEGALAIGGGLSKETPRINFLTCGWEANLVPLG